MEIRRNVRAFEFGREQLVGSLPGILPELPQCKGGRHVTGIPSLAIPTLRITNGPAGIGSIPGPTLFGAVFAEVAIDQDLGLIRVRRILGAYGVGRRKSYHLRQRTER